MKLKVVAIITVILLVLVMSVPVYAETELPSPPDGSLEYWVYAIDGPIINFITGHNPITVRDENGKDIVTGEGGKVYVYLDNKWKLYVEELDSVYNAGFVIVAANHDIAYEDGSGFFFVRPKVSPLIQTMEATDFGTILKNFSAGLIPLIGCLILGISLVKAWEFLRTQLTS